MSLVTITGGGYEAVVDGHGGGLHVLRHEGRPLTTSSDPTDHPGRWDGAVLAPWPNRIDHGRYRFGGADLAVPVNEPERDNALHGTAWSDRWDVGTHGDDGVTLTTVIGPAAGYPWTLALAVSYSVDRSGLTLRAQAENTGDRTAPFGFGVHPYVLAPGGDLDACELSFTAATRLVTDDRMIPQGDAAVAGTEFDFSAPRRIGGARFDTAFGDLPRPGAPLTLAAPGGAEAVSCWWSDAFRWLQLFTPEPEGPGLPRRSIAVEPMTCPADAFNSGRDLIELAPGASWAGELGIGLAARRRP